MIGHGDKTIDDDHTDIVGWLLRDTISSREDILCIKIAEETKGSYHDSE